jgi:Tfp pilus assembly protein PilF
MPENADNPHRRNIWCGEVNEKAEKYYRKALSLEPENPEILNALAWFLIDKNINIIAGLELIDKALELSPDTTQILPVKRFPL